MSEVLQANVFFFITSIAVIVFTLLLCVLLYHAIRITKSVRRIIDRIEAGSEVIAEDMYNLRKYFAEGSIISHVISVFFNMAHVKKRTKKKAKQPSNHSRTELSISEED